MSHLTKDQQRRQVWSWALFDVANSSYTTIIITVAFNVIFVQMIVGADGDNTHFQRGNFYWSLILTVSNLVSALSAPLIGAASDVYFSKRKSLATTVWVCSLACLTLFFAQAGDVWLAATLVVISNIMFNLSESVISSFLPHLVPEKEIGRVSGLAWALGYFGGLGSIVLCYLVCGFRYEASNWSSLRWVGPVTGLFFLIFSLPTFLWVKEPPRQPLENGGRGGLPYAIKRSYGELLHTIKHIRKYRDLAQFLLAYFFFQGGLTVVIGFAALYGTQVVGITGLWQMVFFVTLQVTAALGAYLFGLIQEKLGVLKTINLTLFIWIGTIALIYNLENVATILNIQNTKLLFVVIGNLAGLCLGATQSLARTQVALLSPPNLAGEFFGFWGFTGKLAAVFAIFTFGLLQKYLPIKEAILSCGLFFVLGLFLTHFVRKDHQTSVSSPDVE